MEREWKDSKTNPPKESGRYWCHVEEQNDLGKSTFQWNCCYDKKENSWSDNFETIYITHWTEFLDPPKKHNQMRIEDIEDSLIAKWDYLGWKRWPNYTDLGNPQKDWNQTVMTRINQISASIHQGTCIYDEETNATKELGPADTIMMNEKFLQVMNSLEFFNTEKQSLGRKQVVIDNTIEDNIVFVFRKDVPDDYERKNRTAGAIKVENYE